MAHNITITGSCCSGKTTLLNLLQPIGYTVGEAARYIIHEAQRTDQQQNHYPAHCVPWEDFALFQTEVLRLQRQWEEEAPAGHLFYFHDRSSIDVRGYIAKHREVTGERSALAQLFEQAYAHAKRRRYHNKVFICEPLPLENDAQRKETPQEQAALHHYLHAAYRDAGYEVHPLSAELDPQGRLEEVIKHLPRIHNTVHNLVSLLNFPQQLNTSKQEQAA